jgi:hypothetical protein
MNYRLTCRVCEKSEEFAGVDEANDSDWTEISSLGAIGDGVSKHRAYCPGHSKT